jgi:hypothetical protein
VHGAVINNDEDTFQKRTADPVPNQIFISKDQNGLNPLHKVRIQTPPHNSPSRLNTTPHGNLLFVSDPDSQGYMYACQKSLTGTVWKHNFYFLSELLAHFFSLGRIILTHSS